MPVAAPQETVKFWRDAALSDLEVLRARYVTHSFSRHIHEGYAIGIIEAGTEEFFYRGATHQAHAGELVIIHPGEVHTGHAPRIYPGRIAIDNSSALRNSSYECGFL